MLELIQSVELTSSATSISFSGIPTDGEGLWIVASLWGSSSDCTLTINGSTSATKKARRSIGSASSSFGQDTVFKIGGLNQHLGVAVFDIPFYADGGYNRAVIGRGGSVSQNNNDFNNYTYIDTYWPNANITSIGFTNAGFGAKSKVDIYRKKA